MSGFWIYKLKMLNIFQTSDSEVLKEEIVKWYKNLWLKIKWLKKLKIESICDSIFIELNNTVELSH